MALWGLASPKSIEQVLAWMLLAGDMAEEGHWI